LPIWENTKDENDKIVIGRLDELWENTRNGSSNITKLVFIRHGESDYNFHHLEDSYGKAVLNKVGLQQAQNIIKNIETLIEKDSDVVFIISPLQRDFLTIKPYFESIL